MAMTDRRSGTASGSTQTNRIAGVPDGLCCKAPVRVATTANITLSGLQAIDGVTVAEGNRVLVKNQTAGVENGIYNAAVSAWTRAVDFAVTGQVVQGTRVSVNQGSTQAGSTWAVSTADDIEIDTTAIAFTSADAQAVPFMVASQAEAEAGAINTKLMSPLRTFQALDFWMENVDAFQQEDTGGAIEGIAKPFLTKIREWKTIADFCTGSGDETDKVQEAIDISVSRGQALRFHNGSITISQIEFPTALVFVGESQTGCVLRCAGATEQPAVMAVGASRVYWARMTLEARVDAIYGALFKNGAFNQLRSIRYVEQDSTHRFRYCDIIDQTVWMSIHDPIYQNFIDIGLYGPNTGEFDIGGETAPAPPGSFNNLIDIRNVQAVSHEVDAAPIVLHRVEGGTISGLNSTRCYFGLYGAGLRSVKVSKLYQERQAADMEEITGGPGVGDPTRNQGGPMVRLSDRSYIGVVAITHRPNADVLIDTAHLEATHAAPPAASTGHIEIEGEYEGLIEIKGADHSSINGHFVLRRDSAAGAEGSLLRIVEGYHEFISRTSGFNKLFEDQTGAVGDVEKLEKDASQLRSGARKLKVGPITLWMLDAIPLNGATAGDFVGDIVGRGDHFFLTTGAKPQRAATGGILGSPNASTATTNGTDTVTLSGSPGNLRYGQSIAFSGDAGPYTIARIWNDSGTWKLILTAATVSSTAGQTISWTNPTFEAAAPETADYLVRTANSELTAERVVTDTTDIIWDWATAGQAKANVVAASTTVAGKVELATDGEAQAKSDAARALTPSNLAALGASDTLAGLIEIATQAEVEASSSTTLAVTPGRMHFHPGVAKWWVAAGTAGNTLLGYNVTSVTDTGTGLVTVTVATDMSGDDYPVFVTVRGVGGAAHLHANISGSHTLNAGSATGASYAGSTLTDPGLWSLCAFGDHA